MTNTAREQETEEVVSLPKAPLRKDRGYAALRVPRKGAIPDLQMLRKRSCA